MNKQDLVKYISDKTMITKHDAQVILEVTIKGIKKGIMNDDKVVITDFGSFITADRRGRMARNPQTGEMIKIPAKRVVKFKSSDKLNKMINK